MMAVFTPTTAPVLVTSGPPELPGLSAASVWITCSIKRPVARAQRPPERAHHAARDRVLEAVGVADGDRQLAGAEGLRVAELDRRQVRRRNPDDRDVGVPILTDEVRRAFAAVGQRDLDRRRAVHDVAVGEDEAVGREHEPRSAAGLRPRALLGAGGTDVDADDGRRDAVDGVDDRPRVGVEQFVIRGLQSAGGESHGPDW